VAVFDGECADAVDLVTESGRADVWLNTSNRQEAVDVCGESPLDVSADDRRATLDSLEVTADDGDEATVTVTTAFDEVSADVDFVLVHDGDDWMIDGLAVGPDAAFRGFGARFLSPEETVHAFLLADVEGNCETVVDLSTEDAWFLNWGAWDREEALAACQDGPVGEPADLPDDDIRATLDSTVLLSDDGSEATVGLTIFNRGEAVDVDYMLVLVDGAWKIRDIFEYPSVPPGPAPPGPGDLPDIGADPGPPTPPPTGDPLLDGLAEGCYQGDMLACDDLYIESQFGSAHEAYGQLCGGRLPEDRGSCTVAVPNPLPPG
jgi:hypothetical protein